MILINNFSFFFCSVNSLKANNPADVLIILGRRRKDSFAERNKGLGV